VARWIPWVRTFTPVLAGTSAMPFVRFATANVVGALCWAVGLTVLGHAAATTPGLEHASYVVAAVFVGGSLVAGVVGWVRRRRTARQ
jgi:membrane-associated protein